MIKLSKRLKGIANFVEQSSNLVDCGCDHGKLSIYCLLNNKTKFAYLMDINEEPLNQAKQNVLKYNVSNQTKLILSDGLKEMKEEFDTLVISGMGSELIIKILEDSKDKIKNCKRIILQSNKNMYLVRKYMSDNNYNIIDEDFIFEDKYYAISVFEKLDNKIIYSLKELILGPINIKAKNSDFISCLKKEDKLLDNILKFKNDEFLSQKKKFIEEILGE